LLGKPDIGLLTMTEVVTQARNVCQAVNVPVLADAEAGYGGIANIQRTVREFETAGVAGIFIEDQEHPIMCGSLQKSKKIVSADDMVIKIRAALDARDDSDFVIAARTDADIVSLDEQIRRCNIYAEAGADLVMPVLRDANEYEIVAKEIKTPLWLLLGTWVNLTPGYLKKIGVRGIVTHAVESTFAATKAVIDLMDEIRTKGTVKETLNKLGAPDFRDFFRFIGLREITAREKKIATEGPSD
jgi:2-methylisocitrate lyase-like PEP mutase family enzyme